MQIEVRDSGAPGCETCGSRPLLHTVTTNRALEAELKTALLAPTRPWNLLKKHHNRFLGARVDEVCSLLRAWTLGA